MTYKILEGDCLVSIKTLEDNSIDSVITDPPYEYLFMGKSWDGTGIAHNVLFWKEVLRVLKPGGHLISFAATRTYHRMACSVEDAGFEIKDMVVWLQGQGMPKGLNVGKSIPAYNDWHTQLKPAMEPCVLAMKPISEKTIIKNVEKYGTGAMNIGECRIELQENGEDPRLGGKGSWKTDNMSKNVYGKYEGIDISSHSAGRFPSNVIMDEEAGKMLNGQTGILKSGTDCVRTKGGAFMEHGGLGKPGDVQIAYGDEGGASRFFYCPKVTKEERNDSKHPTIKPINLMRYLVKLITPKGGTILDPFAGTGTTGKAALLENMHIIMMEKEVEYINDIRKRLTSPDEVDMGLFEE